MTQHIPNPHTPEQERTFSNIGHLIEGAIVTTAGATLARGAITGNSRHDLHASRFLIGAGGLLGAGLVAGSLHHGGPVTFFTADHQQRQHLEMSGWILGAGLVRVLGRIGALSSDAFVARVGWMFLTHEQHGTSAAARLAQARHRALGQTVIAASLTSALGSLFSSRSLRAAGSLLMVGAGVQLLTYREPEGAYESDHADDAP